MKYYFLSLCIFAMISCQTGSENKEITTSFLETHKDQKPYNRVLEQYLRSTTVYYNYETLYMVSASMLSSPFYEALSRRVADHYQSTEVLKNFTVNATVFLSIYAPDYDLNDLANKRVWELFIEINGKKYPVKSVKKVKEKESWYAFFPYINHWTTDFIIIFDVPESEKLPPDSKFTFSMINSQTKTTMKW